MKILNRGEIYYANLSLTVGSEQGGIRPVLILQNDVGNIHSTTTIVAPITSQKTDNKQPTHVNIVADGLTRPSTVLVEQIRTIDKMRLREYIGKINKNDMGKVDRAIIVGLGIKKMEEVFK